MAKRSSKTAARSKTVRRKTAKRAVSKPASKTAKPIGRAAGASRTRAPTAPKKRAANVPLDPRVTVAIALALQDDAASVARANELNEPSSAWALAGRARRVHTPWTR